MELNELRKIAEAATPGPWEWEEPSEEAWPTADESLVQSDGNEVVLCGWGYDASGTEAEQVDRDHIATFDPPTVLALLSRLEQAEQAVQRVREAATAMATHSLPEAPRGGAWETAHGAQLFAKDILEALDGDTRRLADQGLGDNLARTTKNGDTE